MCCMVLCRTFHAAPEQGQGLTPIVPHCSGSGSSPCLGTEHSQCDYTTDQCFHSGYSLDVDAQAISVCYRPQTKFGARLYFHRRLWFCPGGGGACSRAMPAPRGGGCLVLGGCLVPGGGVPSGDPPGRLLLRAVRILLECILVRDYI